MAKKNIAEDTWTLREIVNQGHRAISPAAMEALERFVTPWERMKGEVLVEQNRMCDKWYFVSRGLLRVMFTKNGKTDTLFFDGGGGIFTSFHGMIMKKKGIFRVEALADSCGWEISHDLYLNLQEQYPDLMRFELGVLRGQLCCLEEHYQQWSLTTPQERYDMFWDKQDMELIQNRTPHILSKFIPLKVIAQYLGMTPQMLSRLRRRELDDYRKKGKE